MACRQRSSTRSASKKSSLKRMKSFGCAESEISLPRPRGHIVSTLQAADVLLMNWSLAVNRWRASPVARATAQDEVDHHPHELVRICHAASRKLLSRSSGATAMKLASCLKL